MSKISPDFFHDGDVVASPINIEDNDGSESRSLATKYFSNTLTLLKSPYPESLYETADETTRDWDVFEFSDIEVLCYETDGTTDLTVIRRGPAVSKVELVWSNEDILGKGNLRKVGGRITFEPGQRSVSFPFVIFNEDDFGVESLVDIKIEFADPSSSKRQGCLGESARTRVVILNDDTFPHGVIDTDMDDLLFGFLMHNFNLMRKNAIIGACYKLVPGLTFIADQLIMQNIILNVGSAYTDYASQGKEVPVGIRGSITFLAIAHTGTFILRYWATMQFGDLGLGSGTLLSLRSMCVDTMIQLSDHEAEVFPVGRVQRITDKACKTALDKSWMACFTIMQHAWQVLLMIIFLAYTAAEAAAANGTPSLHSVTAIPVVLALLTAIILKLSLRHAADLTLTALDADDNWSAFLVQAANIRHSITNFRKGYEATKAFEKLAKIAKKLNKKAVVFKKHSESAASLIPTIAGSFVMLVLGNAVADGQIEIAGFVVFLNTIKAFGPALGGLFNDFYGFSEGNAALKKVALLLNAETKRKLLKRHEDRRIQLVSAFREKYSESKDCNEDNEILVYDLKYIFPRTVKSLSFSDNNTFRIQAGQLISLMGSAACLGKKTVLRLLARNMEPVEGFILWPQNWRVRFLDIDTPFFVGDPHKHHVTRNLDSQAQQDHRESDMGNLDYNLKFGMDFRHPDPAILDQEIWALLSQLGVSAGLIGASPAEYAEGPAAKKYTHIGANGEKLGLTDRALVSLGAALLSSPQLLLINNLLDVLGPHRWGHAVKVLHDFTRNRGASALATENAQVPIHLRMRRTVIFATKHQDQLGDLADNKIVL